MKWNGILMHRILIRNLLVYYRRFRVNALMHNHRQLDLEFWENSEALAASDVNSSHTVRRPHCPVRTSTAFVESFRGRLCADCAASIRRPIWPMPYLVRALLSHIRFECLLAHTQTSPTISYWCCPQWWDSSHSVRVGPHGIYSRCALAAIDCERNCIGSFAGRRSSHRLRICVRCSCRRSLFGRWWFVPDAISHCQVHHAYRSSHDSFDWFRQRFPADADAHNERDSRLDSHEDAPRCCSSDQCLVLKTMWGGRSACTLRMWPNAQFAYLLFRFRQMEFSIEFHRNNLHSGRTSCAQRVLNICTF